MAKRTLPDQIYLRECFDYSPVCGTLRWRARPATHFPHPIAQSRWNGHYAGTVAGSRGGEDRDRWQVGIANDNWVAGRVIWKWMTGEDPEEEIDHKDRDSMNNAWNNLRKAGRSPNLMNRRTQTRNRLGMKGVFLDAFTGRYVAKVTFRGKTVLRERFDTIEEAREAYEREARIVAGEFFHAG